MHAECPAAVGDPARCGRPTALAYLSAAVDFSVSQVVDVVTGVHAAIRTADLRGL